MAAAQPLVAKKAGDPLASSHSLLGLGALFAELAAQGVPAAALLQGTGLAPQQIDDPQARLTLPQKLVIFRQARRLATAPDTGLRAGSRQRLSDFGVYGYALVSSRTFGDAVTLGVKHVRLAGPVLEKRFRIDGDTAVFEARDVLQLGEVLPLATEFWFASMRKLAGCVLESPMPSRRLLLPYPRPAHAAAYEQLFGCPVQFGAPTMEWHFDATLLALPCPNANPITAGLCTRFCERLLDGPPDPAGLSNRIRSVCLDSRGSYPNADRMAEHLGMSVRTLHRRLADQGLQYQRIVDDVRRSLAIEYLESTSLTVEEIAGRVGFSEASNFRKAFRRWTGRAPAQFRTAAAR